MAGWRHVLRLFLAAVRSIIWMCGPRDTPPPGTAQPGQTLSRSETRSTMRCEPFLSSVPEPESVTTPSRPLIRHSTRAKSAPTHAQCSKQPLILQPLASIRPWATAIPIRTNPHPAVSNFPHFACTKVHMGFDFRSLAATFFLHSARCSPLSGSPC